MTALETRRPRGRPPLFTPEQRQEVTAHVAARVSLGERLTDILGRDGLPSRNGFLRWMRLTRPCALSHFSLAWLR